MNKSYNRREVLTKAGIVMTAALAPNFLAAVNTFEVLMLNKDPDNSKNKIVPKSPIEQPSKHQAVFLELFLHVCLQFQFILIVSELIFTI